MPRCEIYTRPVLSLIPISDANPTRRFPYVTIGLIVANIVAFFNEPGGLFGGPGLARYFIENAPVTCQLTDACPGTFPGTSLVIPERGLLSFLLATIVSTILHAGLAHIAGNMLFLWVFGNNVEDWMGHLRYLAFYLVGGIVAAFAHFFFSLATSPDTCSAADPGICAPTVGASGAVAAVMGGYFVLYPRARVNVLVPIFFLWTVVQLSAFAVLGLFFLYQFLIAYQELAGPSGVAWMAHVGGFVYGAILVFAFGGRPHDPRLVWRPEWR